MLRYPIATPILTQLLLINNDFIEASSVEYRIPMTLRNERADELAAQGAQGLRRRDNAIYVPLDGRVCAAGEPEGKRRSIMRPSLPEATCVTRAQALFVSVVSYGCNVRGYGVLPEADIRCHAVSRQY